MRIGIIGAGQLGQMLGFAARDLGVECRFLDPSDAPPAAVCGEVSVPVSRSSSTISWRAASETATGASEGAAKMGPLLRPMASTQGRQ